MFISAGGFSAGVSCPAGLRHPLPEGSGSVRLQSEHFGCAIPWIAGGAASKIGSPFVIHYDFLCILSESNVLGVTDTGGGGGLTTAASIVSISGEDESEVVI